MLRQILEGRPFLDNCYLELVRPGGNTTAKRYLSEVMEVVPANWRGIGVIPDSGFALRPAWQHLDAPRRVFPTPGCDCAHVVLAKIYPDQCACTPRSPIGPCMVPDEGACRIWWASGLREARIA